MLAGEHLYGCRPARGNTGKSYIQRVKPHTQERHLQGNMPELEVLTHAARVTRVCQIRKRWLFHPSRDKDRKIDYRPTSRLSKLEKAENQRLKWPTVDYRLLIFF